MIYIYIWYIHTLFIYYTCNYRHIHMAHTLFLGHMASPEVQQMLRGPWSVICPLGRTVKLGSSATFHPFNWGRNEDLPEKCGPPVMFVGFSTPWASIMIYICHKPYLTWLLAPTLALTNQRWTGDLVKVGSKRPHNDLSTQSGFFQNLLLARVCVSAFLCVCIYI